jgi:hypothetical protein
MAGRISLLLLAAAPLALGGATSYAWQGTPQGDSTSTVGGRERTPNVQLWVSGANFYHRGERARVYFRTDDDAFVVVVRIDTDGRMRMLYPESPSDDNFARGGVTYRVSGYGRESFYVDDHPGMGYIFAIASWRKLDLDQISLSRRWDYQQIGDRITGDPFAIVHDLAARLTGNREDDYALDVAEYHVDRRTDYPRFLCYDCHAFRSYHVWDPYAHRCAKFRIIVHDDAFYYPFRHYPGTRVVYVRRQRRAPRYELRERGIGTAAGPYVEHRLRGSSDDPSRSLSVGGDALSRRVTPGSVIERPRRLPEGDARIIRPRSETTPPDAETRRIRPRDAQPVEREPRSTARPPRESDRPVRSEPTPEAEPPNAEPRSAEPRSPEPRRVEPRREITPREGKPARIDPRTPSTTPR